MKKDKKEIQCEARWGDRCNKKATTVVINKGKIHNLCSMCAKIVKRQIKIDNNY